LITQLVLTSLALAFLILLPPVAAIAQSEQPEAPQAFDLRPLTIFGISVEELVQVNGITDPGQLIIGMRLVIPGLNGVQGRIEPRTVYYGSCSAKHSRSSYHYGETLQSLSRRWRLAGRCFHPAARNRSGSAFVGAPAMPLRVISRTVELSSDIVSLLKWVVNARFLPD